MNEHLKVSISHDASSVRLTIPGGTNPGEVNSAALCACVEAAKVPLDDGIRARLAQIAEAFARAPGEVDVEIASATPAVPGTDARVDWVDGHDPTHPPEPVRNESGAIDHYMQPHFLHIGEGEEIGVVVEATPGQQGRDVLGKTIPAKPGRPLTISFDPESIARNGQTLSAAKTGVMMLVAGRLVVTDLIEVRGDIDFSTANVDSKGAVAVRGGVRDRFCVRAKRNIQIGGLVEAATLEAGGDIVLSRGMAGRNTGAIKAKGSLTAGFLHCVNLDIGGGLTLGRELFGCNAVVRGPVAGVSATVIGGSLRLYDTAHFGTLGSPAEAATTIHFGAQPGEPASGQPGGRVAVDLRVERVIHPNVTFVVQGKPVTLRRMIKGPARITLGAKDALMISIAGGAPRPISEFTQVGRNAA